MMNNVIAPLEDRASVRVEGHAHCDGDGCKTLDEPIRILRNMNKTQRTSSNGMRSGSSSLSFAHRFVRGGIRISTYMGFERARPTASARVPTASYSMSIFLCWYLSNAKTRFLSTGSRYGANSGPASSSRVANALHPASCTRLLLSKTIRRSFNWICS